jgi:citronellol/citronellal dehydrogenase
MSTIDASLLLRPGLLEGVSVLLAAPALDGGDGFGDAVQTGCAALGAQVSRCVPVAADSHEVREAAADDAVTAALEEMASIEMLVIDAAALFARERSEAQDPRTKGAAAALQECLRAAWTVTRSVFTIAFLPAQRGGRILFLAPTPAGAHSKPALAGLENLSRTLSIEWARHRVTAVTIAPGPATTAREVAALAAYLASPAGAYFSGCLLDLRGEGVGGCEATSDQT